MDILYILVPIALVFVALAVKALFWAINNGQYDDLDTEAHRILFDEKPKVASSKELNSNQEFTSLPKDSGNELNRSQNQKHPS
ncbi:cbb3-type cytochrome oxidase assembly protein CcoS [Marinibactrum halimedae]|uniref:Cbb3-type cytochrome oxidase assembly protein CcoS n=1 Tax=Marinibactrum halimedae TaxID=1444977 RepID=A0AA37WLP5_9GAMM|nr:cbb3-type cytochrome oxidase assembly protein CcoS [Marinibactrum halimedae]MCD9457921.1 cbb3-type cytochrome oxidase assembly protein CcoS [Marinibactrum halimedae]GLS26254.1 hypothetical protein GCM10007877_19690 [Marinibactrum halimedae]